MKFFKKKEKYLKDHKYFLNLEKKKKSKMDQNGWNQKVEDGEGVRAIHIDAPETDENSSLSCKERGNWHFRRAEYEGMD